jgi:hypothetical protein
MKSFPSSKFYQKNLSRIFDSLLKAFQLSRQVLKDEITGCCAIIEKMMRNPKPQSLISDPSPGLASARF